MKFSVRRLYLNFPLESFRIKVLSLFLWRLSSPWGNYRGKTSLLKKNQQWRTCRWDVPLKILQSIHQIVGVPQEGVKRDKRSRLSQNACSWPRLKTRCETLYHIIFPLSSRNAEESCWVISTVNKCVSLTASCGKDRTPWGKDTDLSFVYSIGADVLPGLDKHVEKRKGMLLLCGFCYCRVNATHLSWEWVPTGAYLRCKLSGNTDWGQWL